MDFEPVIETLSPEKVKDLFENESAMIPFVAFVDGAMRETMFQPLGMPGRIKRHASVLGMVLVGEDIYSAQVDMTLPREGNIVNFMRRLLNREPTTMITIKLVPNESPPEA